jgi:hypothetical protein
MRTFVLRVVANRREDGEVEGRAFVSAPMSAKNMARKESLV